MNDKVKHTGWSHWEEDGTLMVDRVGFQLQPVGYLSYAGRFYPTWEHALASEDTCFHTVYREGPNE